MCVIGAGASGLTAIKALREEGVDVDCFEMGTLVGGMWAEGNDNGRGGLYRSLSINTSTRAMAFSDFPMPADIDDFPSHEHIARYFAAYADRFDLRAHILLRHEVISCTPDLKGYFVKVRDKGSAAVSERFYEAIVVANGHHFKKAYPLRTSFEGFNGAIVHSHDYVSPSAPIAFEGKRVLVVGMGNSSMDIACELATAKVGTAARVVVAARRGVWILPKYILGRPLDQGRVIPLWLPKKFRRHLVTRAFRFLHGSMRDFGLPEPDHLIGEAHPTVSSEFPGLVKEGRIHMRPGFVKAHGSSVTFDDGGKEDFDVIVFATGYDVDFPFFDPAHISAKDNVLRLYQRAFHLEHRRAFFIGLAQTVGAIMPLAEAQAHVVAKHIAGTYNLPERNVMEERVSAHEREMNARFVASRRHTMQVIPEEFLPRLRRDLQAGMVRARAGRGIAFPR